MLVVLHAMDESWTVILRWGAKCIFRLKFRQSRIQVLAQVATCTPRDAPAPKHSSMGRYQSRAGVAYK